jgi:Mg-chelatase subunit ChlI
MAQRPILKDGTVVNVIEIGDDTEIVSKAQCKQFMAEEDARYQKAAAAWRETVKVREDEIRDVAERLALARMTVNALKVKAAEEENDTKAAQAFRRVMAEEEAVTKLEAELASMSTRALPQKPRLIRAKRWFHPDGLEVGPAGGNIGDAWNGQEYVRPTTEKAA